MPRHNKGTQPSDRSGGSPLELEQDHGVILHLERAVCADGSGRHAAELLTGLRSGALILSLHELHVDTDAFTRGLGALGASRTAKAFNVGANWYANPFIKWVFNVERTVFDDAHGPRPSENAIPLRGPLSV